MLTPIDWLVVAGEALWGHRDLADLIPVGSLIVAEQGSHFIQLDEPYLVMMVVRQVVGGRPGA